MLTDLTDSRDSSTTRGRTRGHNPKSPEDDANGGDLYIRLSTQKKLRKVRNTVYEDPGNPFDFGAFDLSPSPSTSQETPTEGHTIDYEQSDQWADDPQPSYGAETRMHSMLSNPFDLLDLHNPANSQRDTLRPSRSNRRSTSVDISFMPERRSKGRDETSDTDQHWPGDVPLLHTKHPSGTIFTTESKRDTWFYDFYDDLLAEYGVEKDTNIDYGSMDYRLMSVTY